MKAWYVTDKNGSTDIAYVVFAETRGKAVHIAMRHDDFDWYTWNDMRATRMQKMDQYYCGKQEMDWCDMEDRVLLVREAGFFCSYDVPVTREDCLSCPAHPWCERYDSVKGEEKP